LGIRLRYQPENIQAIPKFSPLNQKEQQKYKQTLIRCY
jgi:hypothetical protein